MILPFPIFVCFMFRVPCVRLSGAAMRLRATNTVLASFHFYHPAVIFCLTILHLTFILFFIHCNMKNNINGQTAKRWCLVTGAGRGIGRAVALRLAADGMSIILHARKSVAACEAMKQEIEAHGGEARILCFDVCDRQAVCDILTADIEAHGAYYGIVCNAGIAQDGPFPAMSGDGWDAVLRTDLDSFYNVIHPCLMPMIQARKGGRIVTISSVSGVVGNRGQVNYSAAKAGIIGATKALALELAKRRITVNCVAPGLIDTDMTESVPMEEAMKMIPMHRAGSPEEVAAAVSFLMSDDAAYITRQVLQVNGGLA